MENAYRAFHWATALVVAFWAAIPELTQVLLMLMAIDVVLGVVRAIHERDLSAQVAWRGVTKKVVTLFMVGVAAVLNPYVNGFLEINLVQAASAFYIIPELTSIVRNAAALDVPMFAQMQGVLRYFHAAAGTTPEPTDTDTHADAKKSR